jgi:hypothetical protein
MLREEVFTHDRLSENQLMKIFSNLPFNLPAESAAKVARYMCEDSCETEDGKKVQTKDVL